MSNFCPNCGTSVESTWRVCPDCGQSLTSDSVTPSYAPQPVQAPTQTYGQTPTPAHVYSGSGNGFGIAGLILGLIGLVLPFFIFNVVAIILGGVGRNRDDSPGLATAGLVLGIIGLVISIMVLVFIVPLLLYGLFYNPYYY